MKNLLLAVPMLLIIAASGCAVSNTPIKVTDSVKAEVLSYADPIMENIMAGLNSNDYAKFSRDMSEEMKAKIGSEAFGELSGNLRVVIGKYASKTGSDVDWIGEYYRAVYTAEFTEDPSVTVILSFNRTDESHLVHGLWFNSKKLSGTN